MDLMNTAKCFVADKVVKPAEHAVVDFSLKDKNKHHFTFNTKVPVRNPLCVTIPLGQFTYSFTTGGREIVSGTISDLGSLAARATTWLEVTVQIPFDILLSLIKDVADDWDIDYGLDVFLIFDVCCIKGISLPVRNKGTMKLPTMTCLTVQETASWEIPLFHVHGYVPFK